MVRSPRSMLEQVGVRLADRLATDEHHAAPRGDDVGGGAAPGQRDRVPALRLAGAEPAQPDEPRAVTLAQGEGRDRRTDGIRHVVGDDLRHRVDRVGPRQLTGHPREAGQALGDPAGQAGTVARGVLHSPILTGHRCSCLSLAPIGPGDLSAAAETHRSAWPARRWRPCARPRPPARRTAGRPAPAPTSTTS